MTTPSSEPSDAEAIRRDLRRLRKRIAGLDESMRFDDADILLSVAESHVDQHKGACGRRASVSVPCVGGALVIQPLKLSAIETSSH